MAPDNTALNTKLVLLGLNLDTKNMGSDFDSKILLMTSLNPKNLYMKNFDSKFLGSKNFGSRNLGGEY